MFHQNSFQKVRYLKKGLQLNFNPPCEEEPKPEPTKVEISPKEALIARLKSTPKSVEKKEDIIESKEVLEPITPNIDDQPKPDDQPKADQPIKKKKKEKLESIPQEQYNILNDFYRFIYWIEVNCWSFFNDISFSRTISNGT